MKIDKISHMKGGWFIGDFEPSLLKTKDFEVGYKFHPKGEDWPKHVHKQSDEYNLLFRGKMNIVINDEAVYEISEGDLFVIERGEWAAPEFLEDCHVITVKTPSIPGDKHVESIR